MFGERQFYNCRNSLQPASKGLVVRIHSAAVIVDQVWDLWPQIRVTVLDRITTLSSMYSHGDTSPDKAKTLVRAALAKIKTSWSAGKARK